MVAEVRQFEQEDLLAGRLLPFATQELVVAAAGLLAPATPIHCTHHPPVGSRLRRGSLQQWAAPQTAREWARLGRQACRSRQGGCQHSRQGGRAGACPPGRKVRRTPQSGCRRPGGAAGAGALPRRGQRGRRPGAPAGRMHGMRGAAVYLFVLCPDWRHPLMQPSLANNNHLYVLSSLPFPQPAQTTRPPTCGKLAKTSTGGCCGREPLGGAWKFSMGPLAAGEAAPLMARPAGGQRNGQGKGRAA